MTGITLLFSNTLESQKKFQLIMEKQNKQNKIFEKKYQINKNSKIKKTQKNLNNPKFPKTMMLSQNNNLIEKNNKENQYIYLKTPKQIKILLKKLNKNMDVYDLRSIKKYNISHIDKSIWLDGFKQLKVNLKFKKTNTILIVTNDLNHTNEIRELLAKTSLKKTKNKNYIFIVGGYENFIKFK